jgi:hypothetical protein
MNHDQFVKLRRMSGLNVEVADAEQRYHHATAQDVRYCDIRDAQTQHMEFGQIKLGLLTSLEGNRVAYGEQITRCVAPKKSGHLILIRPSC